jgi:hypothetical protein
MLSLLTVRYAARPQRWAAVPAAVMGLGGILLIGFGPLVRDALDWIWPPGEVDSGAGRILIADVQSADI